ncbi:hypothetical protein GCM10023224_07240 [Streptomonospora halophila]|uniref:DUF3592 domain-containing protein n=1 Tax=Streptomonospora halophila TaxID=427369 RepID=A0ABP9G6Z8_9ACTN
MGGKMRFGSKRKRRRQSVLGIGGALAIVGAAFLLQGMTDYTDHTARAEATVVERDVDVDYDDDGDRREDVTVYVDYAAAGAPQSRVELRGLGSDDFHEGETLTVAYAPGEPGHAVTPRSTEKGAYAFGFYLGVPILLLGLGTTAVGVLVLVRKGGAKAARLP